MRCLNWEYAKHSGVKSSELKGRCLGSGIIQRAPKPKAELCPSFNATQSWGENKSEWYKQRMGGRGQHLGMRRAVWLEPRGLRCPPDRPKPLKARLGCQLPAALPPAEQMAAGAGAQALQVGAGSDPLSEEAISCWKAQRLPYRPGY